MFKHECEETLEKSITGSVLVFKRRVVKVNSHVCAFKTTNYPLSHKFIELLHSSRSHIFFGTGDKAFPTDRQKKMMVVVYSSNFLFCRSLLLRFFPSHLTSGGWFGSWKLAALVTGKIIYNPLDMVSTFKKLPSWPFFMDDWSSVPRRNALASSEFLTSRLLP